MRFDSADADEHGESEQRLVHAIVAPPVVESFVGQEDTRSADANRAIEAEVSSEESDGPAEPPQRTRQPDPIVQSLMLLATMAVMLAAARFAVPQIVEEIRYAWHRGELRAEYDTGNEGLKNVSLDSLSQAYQMVTAAVGPSVVHIEVARKLDTHHSAVARFTRSDASMVADQGSGVIIDEAGYLVTNRHVIADGEGITVTLSDGRRTPATVVGTDALTDVAVLKIQADRLMPIAWGDSDRCRVGSPVWAVGSPFGLDRTVTFGILSGKHRMVRASTQYQDFMQSDVAVNPGNSGGPLVDARGRLVGINTAIVGETYQGVSFSIPSNVVHQVYERLKATGKVERGWLGVGLTDVADNQLIGDDARVRGAVISTVTDGESPASVAGLKAGDLILRVNRQAVADVGHLMRMIGDSVANTVVELEIYRDDQKMTLPVRLGTRPGF
ncbi:S1C family serine protease [Novipirellula artificiosorum]|uniref:S1C family serine protease n=1 Tax=Novipirellula artificiosorum TaxID=2528016 RepID=UPI0036F3F0C0